MIFGKKQDKSSSPQALVDPVNRYLTEQKTVNPELLPFFRSVKIKNQNGPKTFDIRIYDPADAEANKIVVKDYSTLDSCPKLIIYEGSFDEESKRVDLKEKNRTVWLTTFPGKEEILAKVESLNEVGGEVFFYMNKGSGVGGPLGKGACIVVLTTLEQGKKRKKYAIYFTDIVDGNPVNRTKAFDSDKTKEIAEWIKESCNTRLY